jgi:hypothetical protein
MIRCLALAALALGGTTAAARDSAPTAEVEALVTRAGVLNDIYDIERLHGVYAYQQDNRLFDYQPYLFSEDEGVETHFMNGVYRGREGAARLWTGRFGAAQGGVNMPTFGYLIDKHDAQGIITVSPDRKTAKARFRTSRDPAPVYPGTSLAGETLIGVDQSVIYEMDYVRNGDDWRFKTWRICIYAQAYYGAGYAVLPKPGVMGIPADLGPDGWKKYDLSPEKLTATEGSVNAANTYYPQNPVGPDRTETPEQSGCYLARNQVMSKPAVVPFHFAHPVTGAFVTQLPSQEGK